jgi:DNA helicase IV
MLDEPVGVYTVDEVRGLEFDSVVVAEPAAIVEEAPGGLRALYVALTRSTQRLVVLHAEELPESISS